RVVITERLELVLSHSLVQASTGFRSWCRTTAFGLGRHMVLTNGACWTYHYLGRPKPAETRRAEAALTSPPACAGRASAKPTTKPQGTLDAARPSLNRCRR